MQEEPLQACNRKNKKKNEYPSIIALFLHQNVRRVSSVSVHRLVLKFHDSSGSKNPILEIG